MGTRPLIYSLCTTCRGRLRHLRLTLGPNLHAASGRVAQVVLLDANSPDGLADYVRAHHEADVRCGRLLFASEQTSPRFHIARAKNVAHCLGVGDMLVNVDADNFVTPEYLDELDAAFGGGAELVRHWPGRIAVRRELFHRLRGYDESFMHGYGYDDCDLEDRARAAGAACVRRPMPAGWSLDHGDAERAGSGQPPGLGIWDSVAVHREMSRANVAAGRLAANPGGYGVEVVCLNFSTVRTRVGVGDGPQRP